MGSVFINNVTKQFGSQVVLRDLSVEFRTGEIGGLVGPNGCGKTTLLRLAGGEMSPDMGTVSTTKGLSVGYLSQEPEFMGLHTVLDEVAQGSAECFRLEDELHALSEQIQHQQGSPQLSSAMARYDRTLARFEALGGYKAEVRVKEVLAGVGLHPNEHHLPTSALSGGQKCRAALARLLLQDCDMLLLDEPTNHLDFQGSDWLEKYLKGRTGGAVIVSHDRYFLDRVADRIFELERGQIRSYPGNYSAYAETLALRNLTQQRQFEKDKAFIQKEQDFIARHMAGQRTNEAKGRRKRLERRMEAGEFAEAPTTRRRQVRLRFDTAESANRLILACEGLAKQYGSKELFSDLDLEVYRGQRLGIIGANGTGKTTLLKTLVGQVRLDQGHVKWASKVSPAYYDQERAELPNEGTVLEVIRSTSPDMSEGEARSYLGTFLFSGDDVFKPVRALSGGEQSRVRLAMLILGSPDVIILDEPTNHLDIASCEALEEALKDYQGTVILVTHDRYLLDRVADRLLILQRDGHVKFSGNYSEYLQHVESQKAAQNEAESGAVAASTSLVAARPKPKRSSNKPSAATQSKGAGASPYDHLTIEQIEELIESREEDLQKANGRYTDPAVVRDPARLNKVHEQVELLKDELAALESAWEDRAELL